MEEERATTPLPAAHETNETGETNEAIPATHEAISRPSSPSTTPSAAIAQLAGITTMADSATGSPQINVGLGALNPAPCFKPMTTNTFSLPYVLYTTRMFTGPHRKLNVSSKQEHKLSSAREPTNPPNHTDSGTRTTGSSRSITTDYYYSHSACAGHDANIDADADANANAISHLYTNYSHCDSCGHHDRDTSSSSSSRSSSSSSSSADAGSGPGSNGSANANAGCSTRTNDDKQPPYRFFARSSCANTLW
ncbi:hypothetical protein CHU98_g9912 [Xylaria longipes]|nr:hypothetical protein CHU98_g9912 [Xylaria longipes]